MITSFKDRLMSRYVSMSVATVVAGLGQRGFQGLDGVVSATAREKRGQQVTFGNLHAQSLGRHAKRHDRLLGTKPDPDRSVLFKPTKSHGVFPVVSWISPRPG